MAYGISLTMNMPLPDIRLGLQVKVLSIDFSSLEERKLSQPEFISDGGWIDEILPQLPPSRRSSRSGFLNAT